MRNGFFLIALIGLCFASCTEQPKDLSLTATPDEFTASITPTATHEMSSTITNTSSNAGTVTWELSETQQATGWVYSVMVDGQLQTGLSGSFEMDANASKTFVVKVSPNGNAATGEAEVVFKQNDATRANIEYEVTAAMAGPKFSLSKNNDSGTAAASSSKIEYTSVVTNLSNSTLNLRWVRTLTSGTPSRWNIDVCDNVQCHIPSVSTFDISMTPNETFDLKIGFMANTLTGTGDATVYLFEPSDSANTVQVFQAVHTAN